MNLAASYPRGNWGGTAFGGLGHWEEAVGNEVAAEYFRGVELHVALRAGRMKSCT